MEQQSVIYKNILENMSDGVMTVDLKGSIITFNPAAQAILEIKEEDILNNHFGELFLVPPENDDFYQTILDAIYESSTTHSRIVEYHRGKRTKILSVTTSFLKMWSGIQEEKIGVIAVFSDITERIKMEEAMREKDRIEHQLEIARGIQRGLLPNHKLPVKNFDISGWNQAAEQTGGDYYDWFTLPDGQMFITIADVTGHGIAPALIVSVCRAYFRALIRDSIDIKSSVSLINDLVAQDIPSHSFITTVVSILDPEASTMELFSAGHGPLFYYAAETKKIDIWPADDVPLGILKGLHVKSTRKILFSSGDILVLVTDGFFEWADKGDKQFGEERVAHAITSRCHLSADEIISGLYKDVLHFSQGTKQMDDLTAVVIKCLK
jgi:PAS domain S-box-containing protein